MDHKFVTRIIFSHTVLLQQRSRSESDLESECFLDRVALKQLSQLIKKFLFSEIKSGNLYEK
jgi:hypothetical protein